MKKQLKNLVSVTSAAAILCTSASVILHAEEEYLLGDADLDGTVNAVDASKILSYYSEIQTGKQSTLLEGIQLEAANINLDEAVNAIDASLILSLYAANQTASFFTYNGNTYGIYNISYTWEEANNFCSMLGGHLVTISSEEEQLAINENIEDSSLNGFWIGLIRDEDDWKWITDEPLNYLNWTANEPNNTNGSENYVHLFAQEYSGGKGTKYVGEWNDSANDGASYSSEFYDYSNFGFICEWGELDTAETATEEPTSE